MSRSRLPIWVLVTTLAFTSCFLPTANARETVYIKGLGLDGVNRDLDVSRYPALYTGDFYDCMGGESLFNVTKFDVAYYADNLTVLFHLDGTTNIRKEDIMCKFTTICRHHSQAGLIMWHNYSTHITGSLWREQIQHDIRSVPRQNTQHVSLKRG